MPIQINISRVVRHQTDTVHEVMNDVRAADSYRDIDSALFDLGILVQELRSGQGVLVSISLEEEE